MFLSIVITARLLTCIVYTMIIQGSYHWAWNVSFTSCTLHGFCRRSFHPYQKKFLCAWRLFSLLKSARYDKGLPSTWNDIHNRIWLLNLIAIKKLHHCWSYISGSGGPSKSIAWSSGSTSETKMLFTRLAYIYIYIVNEPLMFFLSPSDLPLSQHFWFNFLNQHFHIDSTKSLLHQCHHLINLHMHRYLCYKTNFIKLTYLGLVKSRLIGFFGSYTRDWLSSSGVKIISRSSSPKE